MAELTLTNAGRAKWVAAQAAGEVFEITTVRFGNGRSTTPAQVTALTSPFSPVQEMGPDLLVVEEEPINQNITIRWGVFPTRTPFDATEALVIAEYPAGTEFPLFYEAAPTGQLVFQNHPDQAGYYVGYYTVLNTDPPVTAVSFSAPTPYLLRQLGQGW